MDQRLQIFHFSFRIAPEIIFRRRVVTTAVEEMVVDDIQIITKENRRIESYLHLVEDEDEDDGEITRDCRVYEHDKSINIYIYVGDDKLFSVALTMINSFGGRMPLFFPQFEFCYFLTTT
ncbi:hypothetical protein QVD17_33155 [Tagetes erecta]|uniref:Uncharacterized protein n=1 Tax=Tagetes erecta TaxID=13708 RepID=A0AAD8JWA3_TARER|nr:hypothetical protein QVD17_33155 [Tagetes erecta]